MLGRRDRTGGLITRSYGVRLLHFCSAYKKVSLLKSSKIRDKYLIRRFCLLGEALQII